MGRICLHKGQEKIFQVTKKQKYKIKKAQGTFGDNQLTSTDKARVLFKNLRGNKGQKDDLSVDMLRFKRRLKNLDHFFRRYGNILRSSVPYSKTALRKFWNNGSFLLKGAFFFLQGKECNC